MNVPHIARILRGFAAERNWERFHTPKNLAMALSVEASELVELYQWLKPDQPAPMMLVEEELADILIYAIRLADIVGIDLEEAVLQKIERNRTKHPLTTTPEP